MARFRLSDFLLQILSLLSLGAKSTIAVDSSILANALLLPASIPRDTPNTLLPLFSANVNGAGTLTGSLVNTPPVPPGQILTITNSSDGRQLTFTVPLPPNTFSPYPPSYQPSYQPPSSYAQQPSQSPQWYYSPQPTSPYVSSPNTSTNPVYGFPPYPPAPTNLAYPVITNPGYVPPSQLPQDLQNTLQIPYVLGPPLYLQPYPPYSQQPGYQPGYQSQPANTYGQYETTPGPYGVLPHRPPSQYGSSYGGNEYGVSTGRPVYGLFSNDTTTMYVPPTTTTTTKQPANIKAVTLPTAATTATVTTTGTTPTTTPVKKSEEPKKKEDDPPKPKLGSIPKPKKISDETETTAISVNVPVTVTLSEASQMVDTGITTTEPPFSASAPDEVTVLPMENLDTTRRRKNNRRNHKETEEPKVFSTEDPLKKSTRLSSRLLPTFKRSLRPDRHAIPEEMFRPHSPIRKISQEETSASSTNSTTTTTLQMPPETTTTTTSATTTTTPATTTMSTLPSTLPVPTTSTPPTTTTTTTTATSTSTLPTTTNYTQPTPTTRISSETMQSTEISPGPLRRQRRRRRRRTTTTQAPEDYDDAEDFCEEYNDPEDKILTTTRRRQRPSFRRRKSSVVITTSVELRNDGSDNPFSIVSEDDPHTRRPRTRTTTTPLPDYEYDEVDHTTTGKNTDLPSGFVRNLPTEKLTQSDDRIETTTVSPSRRTFARKEISVASPSTVTSTTRMPIPSSVITESFEENTGPSVGSGPEVASSTDLSLIDFLSEVQKSSSGLEFTVTSSPAEITERTLPPLPSAFFGPSTEKPLELDISAERRHRFVKPEQWGLPNDFRKAPRLALL